MRKDKQERKKNEKRQTGTHKEREDKQEHKKKHPLSMLSYFPVLNESTYGQQIKVTHYLKTVMC